MRCIRATSIAGFVLGWSVFSFSAFAQSSSSLKIEVTDSENKPVSQARVLVQAAFGNVSLEKNTDANGSVNVSLPLKGRYLIQARSEGFNEATRFIEWRDESETVKIQLELGSLKQQVTITSGSRVVELQEESPVKVDVATRQDMITTGYERITDILSEIPGVVTRSGSSGAVGSEQIRGISARQVAVLQDGLPIIGARGIKSGNINLNRQSTGRLERVEVVKGASSALFGGDAIGGVINMISREPTEKVQGTLNFSGGTLGIFDGRGDIGTRYKNLTVFLDLEHHRQNEYSLLPNSTYTVGPNTRRNDLFFKTRYAFNPRFTMGFNANAYHNREIGRNASETGPVSGLYHDSIQNYAVTGDFVPTAKTMMQFRGYSARYDENSTLSALTGPTPPAYANLNERYKRLDGTISHQLASWNFLQGGYEWVQDNYRGANRLVGDNAGTQVTSNDVWVQDKFHLGRFGTLDLGGRITQHSLFGSYAVPKAGMVVRLSDRWTARGSFGMGFRAPDLGQLYFRFANPASFYQVIGNPTLQPEKSRTFSTGVDYRRQNFKIGVSLFRNDIRSMIDTINIGTPRTTDELMVLLQQYGIPTSFNPLLNRQTFIYQNFGRIYTQGFEVDVAQSITRSLRVTGSYAYLDAKDSGTGLGLSQRHRHQGYVRTDYINQKLGIWMNVRGMFFSKWLLNPAAGTSAHGYGIWDFYVSKNLPKGAQAYFTIDNFGNSRDQKLGLATPTFDRPDYGRMYRVGLRWRFGMAEY